MLLMSSACGLFRNKRYMNKLLYYYYYYDDFAVLRKNASR